MNLLCPRSLLGALGLALMPMLAYGQEATAPAPANAATDPDSPKPVPSGGMSLPNPAPKTNAAPRDTRLDLYKREVAGVAEAAWTRYVDKHPKEAKNGMVKIRCKVDRNGQVYASPATCSPGNEVQAFMVYDIVMKAHFPSMSREVARALKNQPLEVAFEFEIK